MRHPLIWTTSDPGVAIVEDGLIVPIGVGRTRIVAQAPGGASVAPDLSVHGCLDPHERPVPDAADRRTVVGHLQRLVTCVRPAVLVESKRTGSGRS